tara:strand:- start:7 stop:147 length:141 start_codon:yes stop_codon:yes gene_type:complete
MRNIRMIFVIEFKDWILLYFFGRPEQQIDVCHSCISKEDIAKDTGP